MAKYTLLLALILTLAGCLTQGQRLQRELINAGAPHPEAVLDDLAENNEAINTFHMVGVQFLLSSPELTDRIIRGRATIAYGRPDRLYIAAREDMIGTLIMEFATKEGEALVYIFTRNERRIDFWRKGQPIEGLPINVAPTDIVQEIFLPEQWEKLSPRDLRIIEFDPKTETATLTVGDEDNPRRRIRVHPVSGGHWVIGDSVYLEDGEVMAGTHLSGYRDYDGIRFPTEIEAEFPQAGASIKMNLPATRSPNFNEELNNEWFDFTQHRVEAP